MVLCNVVTIDTKTGKQTSEIKDLVLSSDTSYWKDRNLEAEIDDLKSKVAVLEAK
jgi:hypothetical protein